MTQRQSLSAANHTEIVDDLDTLLGALPPRIQEPLRARSDLRGILEVVLDLGRPPEARFIAGDFQLADGEVTEEDLQYVVERIGAFGDDNRAGIPRTLHRISCIRNRRGKVVGLTCRVGRAVYGTIRILEDLVFSGKSVLMLGRPGVGKTTMLREVARVLSVDAKKRVIIVDTSNEIAGDGDIPHPAIGHARRMQVPTPNLQHAVMIEAVENHMPQVIIIDEMGTELEASAARTIAERGVQLVATAHGNSLENLIMNPTLADLVGGIQAVTLGDDEARRRGTQKTVLERKQPPTFDIVVEIQSWEKVAVHEDVASTVDAWLRGYPIAPQVRGLDATGQIQKTREVTPASSIGPTQGQGSPSAAPPGYRDRGERGFRRRDGGGMRGPAEPMRERDFQREEREAAEPPSGPDGDAAVQEQLRPAKVFVFGVGREKVEEAGIHLGLPVEVVSDLKMADVLLTTKNHYRRATQVMRSAEDAGKPVYVLRKNTPQQVQQIVRSLVTQQGVGASAVASALDEAQRAAERIANGDERSVDLAPQRAYVRRLQHLVAERYSLGSTSMGRDPQRYVIIYRA